MKEHINYDELVEFVKAVFDDGPEFYDELKPPVEGKLPKDWLVVRDENREKIFSMPEEPQGAYENIRWWIQDWAAKYQEDFPHIFERAERLT